MWAQTYEFVRSTAHRLPGVRVLVPARLAGVLKRGLRSLAVSESPDRLFLKDRILPALAARRPPRLLFVGCQPYTARYGRMFDADWTEFWTLDIDPATARFGSPGRHVVDTVERLGAHVALGFFDVIVLSGVIGFGLDEDKAVEAGLNACRAALRPDGILLLGWNTDRSGDPLDRPVLRTGFVHRDALGIGARRRFAGSTHVYDTLVAT